MSDSMTPQGKPRKSHKKPSAGEQAQEQKTTSGGSASESSTGTDSGMSDLERLLAEEGINLGTVEEDRPAGSEGMSAKNWMISTSTETLVRKKLDTELTEETPPPVSPVTTPADNVLETEPTPPPVEPTPASPPIETEDDRGDDDEGDPFSIMDFLRSFRKKQKKRGSKK